jgi:hypothetical protein
MMNEIGDGDRTAESFVRPDFTGQCPCQRPLSWNRASADRHERDTARSGPGARKAGARSPLRLIAAAGAVSWRAAIAAIDRHREGGAASVRLPVPLSGFSLLDVRVRKGMNLAIQDAVTWPTG